MNEKVVTALTTVAVRKTSVTKAVQGRPETPERTLSVLKHIGMNEKVLQ